LGRFFEFIIFLVIILLIFRLILVIYIVIRETLSTDNIIINNSNKIFDQSIEILKVIGAIFLFVLISLILRWLAAKGKGTVVIPFEDLDTGNPNKGKAIANSLVAELNRIKHINTITQSDNDEHIKLQLLNIPPLIPIQENIEKSLLSIGTFEIGDAKIPVGQVLLLLRSLWPFGDKSRVISGDIQKYQNVTRLVVRLEEAKEIKTWEVTSKDMPITEMTKEMAYKIAMYIAPNITAQTWEGFKFFSEAIANYNKYRQTQNEQYLEKTKKYCVEARKFENKYEKIADLLYEIGIYYLKIKQYNKAEEVFSLSKEINPKNKYLYNAIVNLYFEKGMFLKSESQYNIAISLDEFDRKNQKNKKSGKFSSLSESFAYPYNGLGNIQHNCYKNYEKALKMYQKAKKIKNNFSRPYHNMGNIYLYRSKNDSRQRTLEDYQKAEDNYISSKKYSNYKFFFPYCGLGLVYFYQATKILESDLQNLNNSIENISKILKIIEKSLRTIEGLKSIKQFLKIKMNLSQNRKKLIQEQNELLNKASLEMIQAIDIKNDENLQWNLALIMLWQDRVDEARDAWQEGLEVARSKPVQDRLLIAIFKYLISASDSSTNQQANLNDINNILSSRQNPIPEGILEQIKQDIELILQSLPRHKPPRIEQQKIQELINILAKGRN
jgi:tetratricopeptide (TPR) repeat protein